MNNEKFTVPSATFTERPEDYELKVILPGIGKDDAELHMEGKTLTLKIMCGLSALASMVGVFYGLLIMGIQGIPAEEARRAMEETHSMMVSHGLDSSQVTIDAVYAIARVGGWFALFNLVEIIGLTFLVNGRFAGFHLYAASQLGVTGVFAIAIGLSSAFSYLLWNAI